MMKRKIWMTAHAIYQTDSYSRLIREGYEPFAVIDRSPNTAEIWLKKLKEATNEHR